MTTQSKVLNKAVRVNASVWQGNPQKSKAYLRLIHNNTGIYNFMLVANIAFWIPGLVIAII